MYFFVFYIIIIIYIRHRAEGTCGVTRAVERYSRSYSSSYNHSFKFSEVPSLSFQLKMVAAAVAVDVS